MSVHEVVGGREPREQQRRNRDDERKASRDGERDPHSPAGRHDAPPAPVASSWVHEYPHCAQPIVGGSAHVVESAAPFLPAADRDRDPPVAAAKLARPVALARRPGLSIFPSYPPQHSRHRLAERRERLTAGEVGLFVWLVPFLLFVWAIDLLTRVLAFVALHVFYGIGLILHGIRKLLDEIRRDAEMKR